MRGTVLLLMLALSGTVTAGEGSPSPADAALDRGAAFLVKDAQKWKADHNCVSCHHGALTVWALEEVRRAGRAVDEPVLGEFRTWALEAGDGKTGVPRPEGRPKAFNSKALLFALGLASVPNADESVKAGMAKLIGTVKSDQAEDGSWVAWPETRPPIFGPSDDSVTALGTLAVLIAAENGDESAKVDRDKGLEWLSKTPTDDDPQSVAMRVVVLQRAGRPVAEIAPLLDRIKGRQNEDGGWSQATEMASDAWATGQALYALSIGGLKTDDPAVVRGREFLVRTQKEDGSWEMTSRPIKYVDPDKPEGKGAGNLIPIIGAGSAWGVIGLARSR